MRDGGGRADRAPWLQAYGKVAWRGLLAYAVGLAAEWPFVSQPDYVGPLVSRLGGADISWLVGFFVSAVVYLILVVSSAPETGRHDRQMAVPGRLEQPTADVPGGPYGRPARDVAFCRGSS